MLEAKGQANSLTDIKQHGAVILLLDDMVLENLVVQCPRGLHGRRHGGLF